MEVIATPTPTPLTAYPRYRPGLKPAPILPMSRAEMDKLGWDACDIIIVTGDAYIDHPSFGMALVGRALEAQGFRVGIISQPDWQSAAPFRELGMPRLFFGITAGNMDSLINRYTADRKIRSDDAYTPDGAAGKRPDRAVTVYAQRAREAFPQANIVIGSIEASLRRIAHYDYWSDKVRRSVLPDSKADLLIFGNAERAIVDLAHRLAAGEAIEQIRDLRGTAFMVKRGWRPSEEWTEADSVTVDRPGRIDPHPDPYAMEPQDTANAPNADGSQPVRIMPAAQRVATRKAQRAKTVVRLPSYETVATDPVMYAHASRTFHLESNPGNARALVQGHGDRDVWLNPPPIPLTTEEMDWVFDAPYARMPHPAYGKANIPAWEMIRFSVNIMRGCFGGCTFCSITEHEGRIIQSRSHESIIKEIEDIRDKVPEFKG
ncbi:MAG: YgiQ family radical SAM protein, partial [Moraxellaceae bacterium]|nr:YgiQ family radical SAM protein [Moraxellaceae bacterium]